MLIVVSNFFPKMLNLFAVCAARQREMEVIKRSEVIRRADERWADLYRNLSILTGQKSFGFIDGDYLYDALFHEEALISDFQRPNWLTDQLLAELLEMRKTEFRLFSLTHEMQRLTLGVFLNELKEKISQAIMPTNALTSDHYEDSDETGRVKKLNIYSTHDIFLFNMLAGLGMPIDEIPPFGAAVIFELFIDDRAESNFDESSTIRIWYLNETLKENYLDFRANPLRLPGFDRDRYTVKEFLASFAHLLMTPAEADRGCQVDGATGALDVSVGHPSYSSSSSGVYITVIVIESLVILLFVGLSVKRCIRSK